MPEEMIAKKIPMCDAQEAFLLYKAPGGVSGKVLLTNEIEENGGML